MSRRSFTTMAFGGALLSIGLLLLPQPALADFTGPWELQNWNTARIGPLPVGCWTYPNTSVDIAITPATGPSPSAEFSYQDTEPYPSTSGQSAWLTFNTTAASTATISFDWKYYFFHSWYQVYADLWAYAEGPSGRTEQHLVDFYNWGYTGPRTFTGSASIEVTEGYEFGLIVGGCHFDASAILEGKVTLTNFGVPVMVDIKPGSYPNSFNVNGNGVIPIAILGSADLDVADVDPSTLSFEGAAVRVKGNGATQCSLEDVDSHQGPADGYLDLVCQFVDDFTDGWFVGDGSAAVTGNLIDGTPIVGSDSIRIVP